MVTRYGDFWEIEIKRTRGLKKRQNFGVEYLEDWG